MLVLLVTNYISFQAGQTVKYYKDFSKRTSAAPQATPGRGTRIYGVNQVLRFEPSRLDLGVLSTREPQRREVPFQNPGPETVVIKRARASCGCTMARIETREIPAGGKGVLEVVVDPALTGPEFSVSVSVEYEGRPQVDRILVSGQSTVGKDQH